MFSGIVQSTGIVLEVIESAGGRRLEIGHSAFAANLTLGSSVSVNGACLTVVDFTDSGFWVEIMFESLRCTNLEDLKVGKRVNLEAALTLSDQVGGHLVSGHIDALGRVTDIQAEQTAIHNEKIDLVAIDPAK